MTLYTARSLPTQRSAEDHVEASMLSSAPGYITQSGTPTDEEFEVIRTNFGDPRANVLPTDYYRFRLIASGDGLDSYFTRQDIETSFPNFVRDLRKGQSLLGSHQMATFSYGSSFGGQVEPADETRSEYEGTFYPQWDTPDLRTKNWLVGDYFIGRGVTVNNQSTDDLIRSIELGNVRKTSISFMVGQYVCGIDGRDLISTMFGPMPDEECMHFPGVAYEGQIAWALMKNNSLVETSLVYKNASPSSMLMRKAEALAEKGSLTERQIEQLEGRFQVRLPRFQQRVWTATPITSSSTFNSTAYNGTTWDRVGAETGNLTITGLTEESDMAGRPKAGTDAARELLRQALTTEPEPEDEDADEADATEGADEAVAESTEDTSTETAEAEGADEASADDTAVEAEVTPEVEAAAEADASTEAAAEEVETAAPEAEAEVEAPEAETSEAAAADVSESASTEPETKEGEQPSSESTRAEDVISEFANAAEQLASALARNADAFDSGALAVAARAERAVDIALIDAGCDTTAGSHVSRTYETRSRHLREALGDDLTVESIRSLVGRATLGDTLYEELVKDAVAARTGVQGESFNAPKYRDILMAARDVAYVKDEIASWKDMKKDRFTAGRSVVPRQPIDMKLKAEERKTLPEAPTALPANNGRGAPEMGSILEPRKK